MEFLSAILEPLRYILGRLLEAINSIVGNYGASIILLAIAVSVLLSPVVALARRIEARDKERLQAMAPAVLDAKAKFTGRERFEAIDAIYAAHGYHPIQSVGSVLPLLVQLPFLLAALLLLVDHEPLREQGFLFVRNLAEPDGLLMIGPVSVNLIPLAMTAVTLAESEIRPEATAGAKMQFRFVAGVLLILVYGFPAAVCLYWLAANTVSLARSAWRRRTLARSV